MPIYKPRRGFSLVELVIVVVIVALLAGIAIPRFSALSRKATVKAAAADLRQVGEAFASYNAETGGWPADVAVGVFPPEMTNHLHANVFTESQPLGGRYEWFRNYGASAAVGIVGRGIDDAMLAEIDAIIDDGDINGGKCRLFLGRYLYIVEQ